MFRFLSSKNKGFQAEFPVETLSKKKLPNVLVERIIRPFLTPGRPCRHRKIVNLSVFLECVTNGKAKAACFKIRHRTKEEMRPPINTKIQRHIIDLVIQADNRRNTETGISSTIRNTNERTKTYKPFQSGSIGNILIIFKIGRASCRERVRQKM